MKTTSQSIPDRFSIGISVLCALHCAAVPVLLAVFPTLVALPVDDHVFHEMMV